MYAAAAATIEKQKGTLQKGGYPVDGLPATVLQRAIQQLLQLGSRRVVLSASFSNFDYGFGLQRLLGKEVRSPLLVGLPCGGSTNVPRQRLGFSIAHLTSRRGKSSAFSGRSTSTGEECMPLEL
jgi:hypothetical protein